MSPTKLLALSLAYLTSRTAWADEPLPLPPPPEANGSAASAPPAEPVVEPAPLPPPPPAPAAAPAPAPAPAPAVAPAPVGSVVAATPPPEAKPFVDDYYDRKRGIGMFHSARLALGVMQGTAPSFTDDMPPVTPGETKGVTQGELAFEGVYLGLPSSYGHFHGIEFSTGLRSTPIDFWAQFGTAVSLFNLGHGGTGSLRVGGSFGAGFNLAHGYGYVRGRAAMVLIPARLDAEASAMWTPASASTSNYEEVLYRASVWYRPSGPGGSERAYEGYIEWFQRDDATADKQREFTGVGGGIGMTLF